MQFEINFFLFRILGLWDSPVAMGGVDLEGTIFPLQFGTNFPLQWFIKNFGAKQNLFTANPKKKESRKFKNTVKIYFVINRNTSRLVWFPSDGEILHLLDANVTKPLPMIEIRFFFITLWVSWNLFANLFYCQTN